MTAAPADAMPLACNPPPVTLKYTKREDGEWIKPKGAFHFIRCCDCSLVHLFEFRRNGARIKFRAWRQNRHARRRKRNATTV